MIDQILEEKVLVLLYSLVIFSLFIIGLLIYKYLKYKSKFKISTVIIVFMFMNVFVFLDNLFFSIIYTGRFGLGVTLSLMNEINALLIAKVGVFVADMYLLYYIMSGKIEYIRKEEARVSLLKKMHKKKEIFVIDSDKQYLMRIKDLLLQDGYKVKPFLRGKDAMKAIKQENPVLVILEMVLSDTHGRALCEKLRHDPKTKNIKIIIVTFVTPSYEERRIIEKLNIDAYIKKPFDAPHLLEKVEDTLS